MTPSLSGTDADADATDTRRRTASGIRARNRAAIDLEILETAREHLAHSGAAALSLRAVARAMGMAPSALYRYVASRDELLTRLIVAGYTSLADAVDAALAGLEDRPAEEQLAVIARSMRAWALANPHEFALLYGSPVPDYHAPAEATTEPGTRVQLRLARLLPATAPGPPALRGLADRGIGPMLETGFFGSPAPEPISVARGLAAWSLLLGSLTAELFEQFGTETLADHDAYFETMIDLAVSLVFPAEA